MLASSSATWCFFGLPDDVVSIQRGFLTRIRPPRTRQGSIAAGQAPAPAMGECRLSGACAEEPRPKSLTTRSSPDQRRRPHPSTGCGFLVRKPQYGWRITEEAWAEERAAVRIGRRALPQPWLTRIF